MNPNTLSPRHQLALLLAMTNAAEPPDPQLTEWRFYKGDRWSTILTVNR